MIRDQISVVRARRRAREMAKDLGFSEIEGEQIALCVTELGNNLWLHAGQGTLHLEALTAPGLGFRVRTVDEGPGIADIERALEDGVSTGGGLGSGLAAVRRMMDEVVIRSELDVGTWIEAVKWRS
ncbi:MAG: ATP-binding protein [Chloroflexota bacterium]|nr:ATP-binding protein [Chloroflexota bacterium]